MSTKTFSLKDKKIWVAGHRGLVGSALMRRLSSEECTLLTTDRAALDLTRQADVERWMTREKPDAVILAAAKVGGVHANNIYPADFIYQNLAIETNIIHAAYKTGVSKLLFLGSSCIYPREAVQPMTEEALLSGPLEPTNQWYAVAKIAGIKLCQAYRRQHGCDFISAMPTNLYGIGDNFDADASHVIPALMRKIHDAKCQNLPSITLWGTGAPLREFMDVDSLADGLVFVLQHYSDELPINLGTGEETSIKDLASLIAQVVGWTGHLEYDSSRPDGTPRKLMDSRRLKKLGWTARTSLREGLEKTYAWFVRQHETNTAVRGISSLDVQTSNAV